MQDNFGVRQMKVLSIAVLLCLLFCGFIIWVFTMNITEEPIEPCNCETCNTVKFMDKYSMDWDYEDNTYLLKMAEIQVLKYNSKSPLNYSRAILVTLNRVFDENYPDNIYDVCIQAAAEIGLSEEDFCSTVITKESKYSMDIILLDRWDDTNGSCDYEKAMK